MSEADSILEIGSRFGYNLLFMAVSMKGNRLLSVDWPDAEGFNMGEVVHKELLYQGQKLKKAGFDINFIFGNSHTESVFEQVKKHGTFHTVFIDGDHSYEGVKQDYEMYGPLAEKQIIFHDVAPGNQIGVAQFWAEVEGDKEDYIGVGSKMGIGRIKVGH